MKTQKTFQFKISSHTNSSKLEKLDKLSYQFKKLVNYYCYSITRDKSNIYETAREASPLSSAFCQIAGDVGQEQIESYKNTHFDNKIPVRLDERVLNIKNSSDTDFNYWATISTIPYDQIDVPILGAEKQFNKLENRDFDFQQAQLLKKENDWYLHVTISLEKDIPSNFDHFVGIDLGINNIATLTVQDKKGNVLETKTFDSSYYLEKINHFDKKVAEFKSKNLHNKVDDFYEKKNNFIDDYLHKISNEIVNIASNYSNCCIVLENLKNLKQNQFNQSKNHNKRLQKWHYNKLQEFIQYKTHLNNIPYRKVSPAFTSQVCTHCQQRSLTRRSSNVTVGKCQSCKAVVNNMDRLASVNLVKRLFFYMENSPSHCESGSNETAEFDGFTEAYSFVEQLRTH
jgi:IS605 OrfB family transposase